MRFVEEAIVRAGLAGILRARRAGDIDSVRAATSEWRDADLLVIGAVADLVRAEETGDTVVIHRANEGHGVIWIDAHASDLEMLRAVAVARIAGARSARLGVDWSRHGLELAQVALGFGASDLRGTITRRSGLPILEDESRKVKGQGQVSLASIKRAEIAALVKHAGRLPRFTDEEATTTTEMAAHA